MTKTTAAPAATAPTMAKQTAPRARKRPVAKKPEPKPEVQTLLHQPLTKGSPYTLESANLIMEMGRLKENAESEIIAIQAEQQSIHDQAQRDMDVIAGRAKTEIDARHLRIGDLQRSISLITTGLSNDAGHAQAFETQIERLRQAETPPPSSDSEENEQ